jgi:GDPmannose 4,6-dehydratase
MGKGIDEVGINTQTDKVLVRIDPRYYRPTEVDLLLGNAEKARRLLGWEPKTRFADLVRLMVESDMARASRHNSRGH